MNGFAQCLRRCKKTNFYPCQVCHFDILQFCNQLIELQKQQKYRYFFLIQASRQISQTIFCFLIMTCFHMAKKLVTLKNQSKFLNFQIFLCNCLVTLLEEIRSKSLPDLKLLSSGKILESDLFSRFCNLSRIFVTFLSFSALQLRLEKRPQAKSAFTQIFIFFKKSQKKIFQRK